MSILCQKRTFSVRKARKAQIRLAKKLILEDRLPSKIRLVAGVDVAYAKNLSIGAVAVVNYDSLELIESQTAVCKKTKVHISPRCCRSEKYIRL